MRNMLYSIGSILVLFAFQALGQEDKFVLSPPASFHPDNQGDRIMTNLRDLQDACGLAWLLEDQQAVRVFQKHCGKWEKHYQALIDADPDLIKMNTRIVFLYNQLLSGDARSGQELAQAARSIPKRKRRPIVEGWLRSLFYQHKVYLSQDLEELENDRLENLCQQAYAIETLKDLPDSRYRTLIWRYRNAEIRRLSQRVDRRTSRLTPIRIEAGCRQHQEGCILDRYLTMLHNLKLRLVEDRIMPYERYRTLSGLLYGLRYMDVIFDASKVTSLDPRLMVSLFIQESGFVHHRVSPAGAFSLAQFMNIALKDVWIFKGKIQGAAELLEGIESLDDLKSLVARDPKTAIRVSCLYFRRLRDQVVAKLNQKDGKNDADLYDLLAIELRAYGKDVSCNAGREGDQRVDRLSEALGLAAYNSGMGSLIKIGKRKAPWSVLSFPLQISETRNYVDNILDGIEILKSTKSILSELSRINYPGLLKLADRACKKTGLERTKKSLITTGD